MQRQYHSRLENGEHLIWDVHRFVAITCDNPVQQISISTIRELDQNFWFGSTPATCRPVADHAKLIQETGLRFPVILSAFGRVMDGTHRVCKALLLNQSAVSAVQFAIDPKPDYVDLNVDSLPYDEPL